MLAELRRLAHGLAQDDAGWAALPSAVDRIAADCARELRLLGEVR